METDFRPSARELLKSGELERRASEAARALACCRMCPHRCGVNRLEGEKGECRTGRHAAVAGYAVHQGEEKVIRGTQGSGAVFFGGCNLRCEFCQNSEISQHWSGGEMAAREIASVMLELEARGCHNINLVSPSHVAPQILEAVFIAVMKGLDLPLIFNSGGYDLVETLRRFSGIVDIYMPDMKYSDHEIALRYSKIKDYPAVNQAAILEMHRQTGDLVLDPAGVARRGLLVRHLVLPGDLSGTEETVRFLAARVSKDTYLNLMAQYHPAYHANGYPELNRPITIREYEQAVLAARAAGLKRLELEWEV